MCDDEEDEDSDSRINSAGEDESEDGSDMQPEEEGGAPVP